MPSTLLDTIGSEIVNSSDKILECSKNLDKSKKSFDKILKSKSLL
jgi:hypothetical protein